LCLLFELVELLGGFDSIVTHFDYFVVIEYELFYPCPDQQFEQRTVIFGE
jgi:hypothetical protein